MSSAANALWLWMCCWGTSFCCSIQWFFFFLTMCAHLSQKNMHHVFVVRPRSLSCCYIFVPCSLMCELLKKSSSRPLIWMLHSLVRLTVIARDPPAEMPECNLRPDTPQLIWSNSTSYPVLNFSRAPWGPWWLIIGVEWPNSHLTDVFGQTLTHAMNTLVSEAVQVSLDVMKRWREMIFDFSDRFK